MNDLGRLLLGCGMAASLSTGGCVILSPDGNAVSDITSINMSGLAGANFKPVGQFLDHRCGTLDCHGQIGRNLRIYGKEGLRLNPMDQPYGSLTTSDELDADFRSAVALEPEIMAEVVAEGGVGPERLTLIRKPRATEHHKGGQVIAIGDDQDNCLTSWLAGMVDTMACAKALKYW